MNISNSLQIHMFHIDSLYNHSI